MAIIAVVVEHQKNINKDSIFEPKNTFQSQSETQ